MEHNAVLRAAACRHRCGAGRPRLCVPPPLPPSSQRTRWQQVNLHQEWHAGCKRMWINRTSPSTTPPGLRFCRPFPHSSPAAPSCAAQPPARASLLRDPPAPAGQPASQQGRQRAGRRAGVGAPLVEQAACFCHLQIRPSAPLLPCMQQQHALCSLNWSLMSSISAPRLMLGNLAAAFRVRRYSSSTCNVGRARGVGFCGNATPN